MAPDAWPREPDPGAGGASGEDVTEILRAGFDVDGRAMLATALRDAGWHVRAEVQAEMQTVRALDAVRARHPGLVVASFPTGAGDGCTVTGALRADPRTADLPVLRVTSHTFPSDLDTAVAAGVTASLLMPVAPLCVIEEAGRFLGVSGAPTVDRHGPHRGRARVRTPRSAGAAVTR